jgi:hypothetical protein
MMPTAVGYGRPGSQAARLRQWLHEAILAHRAAGTIPTTSRFLYYEAVMAEIIRKHGRSGGRRPDQDVSVALLWLREQGHVGWDEIRDRTRRVFPYTGAASILAAAQEAVEMARLDPWRGHTPLLIVESESLAGLCEDLAHEYRIVLVPVRGQSSASLLVNDVTPYVERGSRHVLYVGDHDRSGYDIEASAQARLESFARQALAWMRVALTADQVAAYDLPLVERVDRRDHQTRLVAECEAMPQATLVALVRQAVGGLLPVSLDRVRCTGTPGAAGRAAPAQSVMRSGRVCRAFVSGSTRLGRAGADGCVVRSPVVCR